MIIDNIDGLHCMTINGVVDRMRLNFIYRIGGLDKL
jgi:hypothetical protein